MDNLLKDWSNWNPMAMEYSNEGRAFVDTFGQNVVEKAQAPMGKKKALDKNANTEYPYLVLKKKVMHISKCALINFFGRKHVRNIDSPPNSDHFVVYFNDLGSLESAHSTLEAFPQLLQVKRSHCGDQEKFRYEKMSMQMSAANRMPEPVKLPAMVPTHRGPMDTQSRTIHFSCNGNKHPEFLAVPIVDSSCYKSGSLMAIRDAKKRFLKVKFEFNLERHGAYVLEKEYKEETYSKPVIQQMRCGRQLYKDSTGVDAGHVSVDDADEMIIMSGYKRCVACKDYTSTVCKSCDMPFCDALCWSIVSEQHDRKCGTGQSVAIDDQNLKKLLPKAGLPPRRSKVKITAFEQSNVVYVRPADILSEMAYYRVLTEVWMHGKKAPKLDQLPVCGQIVIYKFEAEIVRALVLNVDNPKDICVVCIDFGSVEYTAPGNLYQCGSTVADLPRYATPVKLRGVPRRALTPHLREAMYAVQGSLVFELRYHKREYDYENHMQTAVLIDLEMNRGLNSFFKKIMTPVDPGLHGRGFNEDFLPHVAAPPGKNIDLIVTDNSSLKYGIIHCTPAGLAVDITKMQRAFQDYGEKIAKAETYAAPKGELCIAKYKDKWCRGVSMELVGDGYPSILFVDYGNIVPIHVTDIRAYPEQLTYPILTTEYDLIGLPEELTDAQVKSLEKHLQVGARVTCDEIVKSQENNYSLRLENLQKLLQ
ncbi:protein vreteno isoform X1 [Drosophila guanche]|uniref:Blast:Protein vreteno n=1 Tax=Drosophila guanche TaxID=7266 RepID=A0A3B0JQ22_DROGU|nr:protein vreteno isoform X1 [Drosophila guanche]SPP83003.1 blast:Protein vreteno [Drosophila guanche]